MSLLYHMFSKFIIVVGYRSYRVISIRCPICGMRIENARRHLRKYHGLSLPDEKFAKIFLRLYRIFRRRDEFIPLIPLNEWEYDDFIKVMNILSETRMAIRKKLMFFEPFARYFARRFSTRILEDFPRIVREGNKSLRALAFMTLTMVPSERAVPIIISLCDRRKSYFLEHIVDLFQKYRDSLTMHVKRAIDSNTVPSPSCVFKAVFIVAPENLYELLRYLFERTPEERKENIITEFKELFDYMASFPKRYLSPKPVRKALIFLAKAKFFDDPLADISEGEIEHMIKTYSLLITLDDLWSRLYHGCQRQKRYNIYDQMKGKVSAETSFGSIILRVCRALDGYPEARGKIGEIKLDEYREALEDLRGEYTKGLFLTIMADINLKNGYPNKALALIEELEEIATKNYDYMRHAFLIKALALEFLGRYNEALETHKKLEDLGVRWEKALLDRARLCILLQNYEEAEMLLSQVRTEVLYKAVLEVVIGASRGSSERIWALQDRISKFTFLSDPRKALDLLLAMEYMCYCLYDKAIKIAWEDDELRRAFLDIVMLTCTRHQKSLMEEANRIYPDDPLLSYYMGVLAIEDNRYEDALHFFEHVENVDRKVLLVNKMLAAIMARRNDVAEQVYFELKEFPRRDEVSELAIIHYLMFSRNFPAAHDRLNKIRDILDYEMYLRLRKDILQKRFTIDNYVYYVASREIEETICPLLSVPIG